MRRQLMSWALALGALGGCGAFEPHVTRQNMRLCNDLGTAPGHQKLRKYIDALPAARSSATAVDTLISRDCAALAADLGLGTDTSGGSGTAAQRKCRQVAKALRTEVKALAAEGVTVALRVGDGDRESKTGLEITGGTVAKESEARLAALRGAFEHYGPLLEAKVAHGAARAQLSAVSETSAQLSDVDDSIIAMDCLTLALQDDVAVHAELTASEKVLEMLDYAVRGQEVPPEPTCADFDTCCRMVTSTDDQALCEQSRGVIETLNEGSLGNTSGMCAGIVKRLRKKGSCR